MINQIHSFISQCPLFSGKLININYLGSKTGSVSLFSVSSKESIKEYTDGERLCRAQFRLALREGFSQSLSSNRRISGFFKELSAWLEAQTKSGNLPSLAERLTPLSLVPVGSYLMKNSNGTTARYEIILELQYKKEEIYYV